MSQATRFEFFNWNPSEDYSVFDSLKGILSSGGASAATSSVYTILKDLLLNGLKANQKRIYFSTSGLDILHPSDYELGLRMFKSKIQSGNSRDFEQLAIKLGLYVRLDILNSDSDLTVVVTNNQPMVVSEIKKIRNSFLYSIDYQDIMEFYLERADDSEGEGIGIALIIILLKDMRIPLQNFTIENHDGNTIAQIVFPWNILSSYLSRRNKFS